MDNFHKKYLQECSSKKYEANQNIIQAIRNSNKSNLKESDGKIVLNLSGYSLSPVDCHLLEKCISTDHHIDNFLFTDCLLCEESCQIIINAFCFNKYFKLLDMKGNNLRSSGGELLGKLLKRTSTLQQLYVEWNSLGLWDTGIKALADGLAVNESLKVLDISNNQISHEGGQEIAHALKRNKILNVLDLRWNNVGVLGGRALLSAFDHNKYITNLQLNGNNIPSDILKAINTALKRNVDYRCIFEEQENMKRSLKQEIELIHHEKSLQVSTLLSQLEKEKSLHESFTTSTRDQVEQLKDAVETLQHENKVLREKNQSVNTELEKFIEKNNELKVATTNQSKEISELKLRHSEEINNLTRMLEIEKTKVKEAALKNDDLVYSHKKDVRELEDQIEIFKKENSKLKETLIELKREKENELSSLVEKTKRDKESLTYSYNNEIKEIKEKLNNATDQKHTLEREVAQLKSDCLAEKLKREEELMTLRARLKQEEMMKAKQYEERIDLLTLSKDELQSKISKLTVEHSQALTQLTSLQKDLEQQRRQFEQQQNLLNQRDIEHRNEITRVRNDVDSEKRVSSELRDKLQTSESKIQDLSSQLREVKSLKENEIISLKEAIAKKDDEVKRSRDDELRRVGILESALSNYINSARGTYK